MSRTYKCQTRRSSYATPHSSLICSSFRTFPSRVDYLAHGLELGAQRRQLGRDRAPNAFLEKAVLFVDLVARFLQKDRNECGRDDAGESDADDHEYHCHKAALPRDRISVAVTDGR